MVHQSESLKSQRQQGPCVRLGEVRETLNPKPYSV